MGRAFRILGGGGDDTHNGGREKDTINGGNGTGDCAGETLIHRMRVNGIPVPQEREASHPLRPYKEMRSA